MKLKLIIGCGGSGLTTMAKESKKLDALNKAQIDAETEDGRHLRQIRLSMKRFGVEMVMMSIP